ncbi:MULTISPECIES: recombinase family protein [Nocardia]|uniref:recombinase family protein n=1 Tax=Nocardia TaxID=1817 RepID=UPI0024560173|nr:MULTISPECIES: recombinase family protein [Nocardia]
MPLNPRDHPGLSALIQARVSKTTRQKGERSPKEQIEWAQAECERFDWPVHKIINEGAVGATRHARRDRPGREELRNWMAEVAEQVRRGEIVGGVLVNWSQSRANRKVSDMADLREMCAEFGVYWYYGGVLYDMNDPDDRKRVAQDAVEDEHAPERNRQDSMRALEQNFLDGKPHGPESFGYRIEYERGTAIGRVHDPVTSPAVIEMARRALDPERPQTMYMIAKWATEQQVPIPSIDYAIRCRRCSTPERKIDRRDCECPKTWQTKWTGGMVSEVLIRPSLAALRIRRNSDGTTTTVRGTWPPLISPEQHERLKTMLTDPRRKSSRGTKSVWLLSGIPDCGRVYDGVPCAGKVFARTKKNRPTEYTCRTCYGTSRQVEPVDALVQETILRRLERADFLATLAQSSSDARQAAEDAQELRDKIESWLRKNMEDDPDPDMDEIRRYKSIWMPRLRKAEQRARTAMPLPHVTAIAGKDVRGRWATPEDEGGLSVDERKDIIRSLITITFKPVVRPKTFGPPPFDPDSLDIQWLV